MNEGLYTKDCIRTVSGRYVNLVDPDPATFDIGDIAHALSNVPRFGGHLCVPWSVAQHSLLVASMVVPELRLQALLHDASEAFLCDIPSPLKAHLPKYRAIEDRMMLAIAKRFGMDWPMAIGVKLADKQALELEWTHLMCAEPAKGGMYDDFITIGNQDSGGALLWLESVHQELRSREQREAPAPSSGSAGAQLDGARDEQDVTTKH